MRVLWVAHTYVYLGFPVTPRLLLTTPDIGVGKTETLETVTGLSCGGIFREWGSTTQSAIERMYDARHGDDLMMGLDQCDYLSRHDTGFLSMLTTGYRVGAVASKSVPAGKKGNEWQPADFVIGWPMAFAKVGDLPTAQLMSRCVVIRMQPAPVESRKPMKLARKALLFDRDNKLAPTELSLAWQDRIQKALGPHEEALGAFVSESDGEVAGRTDDVWEPLLAIAHVAGERWRLRARDAYAELKADNLMVPKPSRSIWRPS